MNTQGINFTPDRLVVPTKKPHILLDFAEAHGKQHEMQEALFKAYFTDGRNVSSNDVLRELAGEVGLDQDKAVAALSEKKYVRKFEEGIKETKTKGLCCIMQLHVQHFLYLAKNLNVNFFTHAC